MHLWFLFTPQSDKGRKEKKLHFLNLTLNMFSFIFISLKDLSFKTKFLVFKFILKKITRHFLQRVFVY